MDLGWPADMSLYKLASDWGSLIGAGVALLAAGVAYAAVRRQTKETQAEFQEQRAADWAAKVQAKLVAATLIEAALEAFKSDLSRVQNMFDPAAGHPNPDDQTIAGNRARWLRGHIRPLISGTMLPYLGQLQADLVHEYFLIAATSEWTRDAEDSITYSELLNNISALRARAVALQTGIRTQAKAKQ
jgi:hypothetical protein